MYINATYPLETVIQYFVYWVIFFAIVNFVIYIIVKKKEKDRGIRRIVIALCIFCSVMFMVGISYILFLITLPTVEPPPETPYMDLRVLNTSKSKGIRIVNFGGNAYIWETEIILSDKNTAHTILPYPYPPNRSIDEATSKETSTFILPDENAKLTIVHDASGVGFDKIIVTNLSAPIGEVLTIRLLYLPTNDTIWEGKITLTE